MNPLKEIINIIQKKDNIKIGKVIRSYEDSSDVQVGNSYINVWGSYPVNSNVYIKDKQILGKIKKESQANVLID